MLPGQSLFTPSQNSAGSQRLPSDARHSTLFPPATTPSAGHAPVVPVQLSATSQTPFLARQVVVPARNPSTQVLAVPRQESVPSQAPPLELPTQDVVAEAKPFAAVGDEP